MNSIFQICVEGNTGSTGRIAESLGILALQQGWESYIAFGRFPRQSRSNLIPIGFKRDVFLHGLRTRILDEHCLGSEAATRKLIKKIEETQPAIIQLHHLHGYYINIKILFEYLASASIPVVWTFHDCWSITGHCCHFEFIGCQKWKTECNQCSQKKEYPASLIIDRSKENYYLKKRLFNSVKDMTIVAVSKWLDSVIKESFLSGIKRKVIYNGIDVDVFKPENRGSIVKSKLNIENKYVLLGVANRWSKHKGINEFFELSKIIKEDTVILLIGLSRNQIKGLPKNIIGLKKTENEKELRDYYEAADIYINLSVEESFGLTTAEALACGTPAIVYNSTACPEIVDERTGLVVERQNIEALLHAIDIIKSKGKLYFSTYCRERAVKFFNKEERLTEYIE